MVSPFITTRYLVSDEEKDGVLNEINHLSWYNCHGNVIRLHETYESPEHIYLVMERATDGNLEQLLQRRRRLSEVETVCVMKQLLEGIDYLHDQQLVHLDLKPANILFSEIVGEGHDDDDVCSRHRDDKAVPSCRSATTTTTTINSSSSINNSIKKPTPLGRHLKLCDFGLSRRLPPSTTSSSSDKHHQLHSKHVCGTGGYIAPEILKGEPFGKPADLWGLGVLCYQMLCGLFPFIPANKCLTHPVSFEGRVWAGVSKEAKDFIAGLLVVDQRQRMNTKQALAHPWIVREDTGALAHAG